MFTSFLQTADDKTIQNNDPCPWWNFSRFLSDADFRTLAKEFPRLDHFERHSNIPRGHHQRPHDRFYLALTESRYGPRAAGQPGVIQIGQLSPTWRAFIAALRDEAYLGYVCRLIGHSGETRIRFAWHVTGDGGDVSPHVDMVQKAATHIFYFNTLEDWSSHWGGATVFYSGKRVEKPNLESNDFASRQSAESLGNRSLLFKNTPLAWHGVEKISCPPESFRRIFNVIFEDPPPASRKSFFGALKRWRAG